MTTKLRYGLLLSGVALWAFAAPAQAITPDQIQCLDRLETGTDALARRLGAGEIQVAQASGGVPQSVAADFEIRLQRLEQALQDLTGRVEEATHQAAQANDAIKLMRDDFEFRFQALEKGGAAGGNPPVVGGAASAGTPAAAPTLSQGTKPGEKAPSAGAAAQTPASTVGQLGKTQPTPPPEGKTNAAPAGAPPASTGNPQTDYENAYALLRTEDWDKAEKAFSGFIAKNPKHAMAGNAQYWLGETYYVRGKYQEAAVAFAEGFKNYPTNNKAPDNLLKLGLTLAQLGKSKEACTAYAQLTERFPAASVAIKRRADTERRKLNCK